VKDLWEPKKILLAAGQEDRYMYLSCTIQGEQIQRKMCIQVLEKASKMFVPFWSDAAAAAF
jgi:hypothetical protein